MINQDGKKDDATPLESAESPLITRRHWLGAALGAVALPTAGILLGDRSAMAASSQSGVKKRSLRLAHLTDIHVKATAGAPDGMAAALDLVHGLDDKPDFILQGGDLIMDALAATEDKTREQWTIAKRTFESHCKIPIIHCIGNHDIWGWQKAKSQTTGQEPSWGKKWALDELGLERPYYSLDRNGWHIVVLDTVQDRGDGGYRPYLDEPQWEWLEGDLKSVPPKTPILVLGHVPFFSIGAMLFNKQTEKDNQWKIPSALMMLDARRFKDLARRYANIRLCLAGHIHLLDRVEYNGVTYITTGAVSGNWWGGTFQETPEGYGLVDLYDDGSFEYKYVPTGWKVPPRPPKTDSVETTTSVNSLEGQKSPSPTPGT